MDIFNNLNSILINKHLSYEQAYLKTRELFKNIRKIPAFTCNLSDLPLEYQRYCVIRTVRHFNRTINVDKREMILNNINRISYPPKDKVRRNRYNNENTQIFYCGFSKMTSVFELFDSQLTDDFCLTHGIWQIQNSIEIICLPDFHSLAKGNKINRYILEVMNHNIEKKLNKVDLEYYRNFLNYFSEISTYNPNKKVNVYAISCCYYDMCRENSNRHPNKNIEGILYPSRKLNEFEGVGSKEVGFNIALEKHVIDKEKIKLIHIEREYYHFNQSTLQIKPILHPNINIWADGDSIDYENNYINYKKGKSIKAE